MQKIYIAKYAAIAKKLITINKSFALFLLAAFLSTNVLYSQITQRVSGSADRACSRTEAEKEFFFKQATDFRNVIQEKNAVLVAEKKAGRVTGVPYLDACVNGNIIGDGGFEATNASTFANPFWTSTSSSFGTSLCNVASCGTGGGTAGPRTGSFWVWFGGTSSAEVGTAEQSIVFPTGAVSVTLNYYLRIGSVTAPFDATMVVKVDGVTQTTYTEPSTAEAAYTLRTLDLTAYADGLPHVIRFEYNNPAGSGNSNFTVDDVSLDVVCSPCTGTPTAGTITGPATPVCAGSPVALALSGATSGTGITYQWKSSATAGGPYTNIVGATSATYNFSASATAYYICTVTCTASASSADTPEFTVNVSSPVHSGVSATPNSMCSGSSTVIAGTASGGLFAGGYGVLASSGTINLAIPDNNATGASSSITLPATTITAAGDLTVRVNMTHTWTGDVALRLTGPCGTTYLFDRPGVTPPATCCGNSGDLSGIYTFTLSAASIIPESGGGTIAAGSYLPSDANGASHSWTGLTFPCAAGGSWTLTATDGAGGDLGTIVSWEILGPITLGAYSHTLTGPGTIVQNPATGPNGGTANFSVSAIPAGNHVYVLTSTDGTGCSVSSNIPVTVSSTPVITTQPVNRVICQNGNTTFAPVFTSGTPPTFQWQISTAGAGGPWTNLVNVAPFSGVTTGTLTLTGTGLAYNGNYFQCIITNVCGTTTTTPAMLTVNPLPVVNSGPSGLCAPVTIIASGNANTWAWTPATGLNTTTGTTVIASPTTTTVYTVTGTITATGCQNSASVTVLGTPATPAVTPANPVICAGTIQPLTVTPITNTVTYTGAAMNMATSPSGPASVYPAIINVSGLPTSGVRVKSVTLNGVSHTWPSDVDVLVQSPTGTNVIVMSDRGGSTDIINANLVFDDAAAAILPTTAISSGTYKPSNTDSPDNFAAPGPGSITNVNPTLSTFTGNFNGNWNLFVVDDLGGDGGSVTSWSITFEVPTAVWTPVTNLFTDAAATVPYVAGAAAATVYFTASPTTQTAYNYSVTSVLGTCSSPTSNVTVTVNPLPTISVSPTGQCGPVSLTATGTSTAYAWSPAAGLSSTTGATVTADPQLNTTYTVTGTITATGCTKTATTVVNATPATPVVSPTAISICQGNSTPITIQGVTITSQTSTGTITVPAGAPAVTAAGPASPYPTVISIGGLPTSGVRVKSVQINGINHTWPDDMDILLQAPTGTNVVLMSDAGGSNDLVNTNFVFDDAAASTLSDGNLNASGTYKPTNYDVSDSWVAPGPGAVAQATPALSMFTGNLNGNWNLYVVDDLGGDVGSIASWSITFEVVGAVWTPATGLYTDAATTTAYTAGTMSPAVVYAKPTTTTTYTANRASVTCTSANATSVVTVYNTVSITTQPASQTVCSGVNVTFSVVASGNSQSYQWQLSTNAGSTWTNITNANAASLTLTAVTTAMNAYQYRCVVTNSCFTATSNAAVLTVNALPTVVATDLWNRRICISDTLVPLVGTPAGGNWSGIGVSGFNFVPPITAVGTYVLTYTYTNTSGCTASDTTKVVVVDCPERLRLLRDNAVILYPNPNNGQFNIRMNSVLYNYLGMDVYTTAGQRVYQKVFTGLVYGRVVPINLTHLPQGVYMIKFFYDDGARTSEKGFPVLIGE
ncbi:MAG: T9SS type A sorting domain-containing protein [Chitinophagaceae bacterium]|nr:T9SS type A sorting domain-containing protein [Chitinophagaceae bacterium]